MDCPAFQNEEADALTNSDLRPFDPRKRVEVRLEDLRFGVLHQLLETGDAYHTEVEQMRASERALRLAGAAAGGGGKRRKAGDSLRERDPW